MQRPVKAVFDSVRVGKTFRLEDVSESVKAIIDEIVSQSQSWPVSATSGRTMDILFPQCERV